MARQLSTKTHVKTKETVLCTKKKGYDTVLDVFKLKVIYMGSRQVSKSLIIDNTMRVLKRVIDFKRTKRLECTRIRCQHKAYLYLVSLIKNKNRKDYFAEETLILKE